MGFFDLVSGIADIMSGVTPEVQLVCNTLELFELGTTWRGTARVHGAGRHIATEKVNYSTTASGMGRDYDYHQNATYMRRDLMDWANASFTNGVKLPEEAIVLNEGENCLTCEGFVKKVGGKWVITPNASEAEYYGAFKIIGTQNGTVLGNKDLDHWFKCHTKTRIMSIDITDGF